ncbi:MAG: hypothetical protein LBP30_01895 [Clostridiales Family XIII bacterium]|nr:hypothetical protein [Clostridiales Family XIII bacterium]
MKKLLIELKSDLCSFGGNGFAGVVDMDLEFDTDGLPFLPTKRMKGLLRESALDILDCCDADKHKEYKESFDLVFGVAGREHAGALILDNGRLANASHVDDCTSLRTRTAMEDGQAKEHSLRTMRVVNRGSIFEARMEFPEERRGFIELCCKGVRHMGLNRTRGYGEVCCRIEEQAGDESHTLAFAPVALADGTAAQTFVVTLDEPVIVADRSGKPHECESYLPGNLLYGCFASRWIDKHGADADFRRIFLKGAVKFSAAFPVDEDGVVYRPAPITLKTDKEKKRIADGSANTEFCKPLGGFVCGDTAYKVSHDIFAHHARPNDKSIGHATDAQGQFYGYKALSRRQAFACRIIGGKEDLEKLEKIAPQALRLGRSRTAQYGAATLAAAESCAAQRVSIPAGAAFRAVVQTPLILADAKDGAIRPDVKLLADAINDTAPGAKITSASISETVAAGYNAKWRLPRPQMRAVAEGSVVVFENTGGELSLEALRHFGLRTGEGFGEVLFEAIPENGERKLHSKSLARTGVARSTANARKQELKSAAMRYAKGKAYGNSAASRMLGMLRKSSDFAGFALELNGFEQPKAKTEAVLLCIGRENRLAVQTGDFRSFFETKARNISSINNAEGFDEYKIWLEAVLTQVKYNNRDGKGGCG